MRRVVLGLVLVVLLGERLSAVVQRNLLYLVATGSDLGTQTMTTSRMERIRAFTQTGDDAYVLGIIEYRQADFASATSYFDHACFIAQHMALACYLLGRSIFDNGQVDRAVSVWRTRAPLMVGERLALESKLVGEAVNPDRAFVLAQAAASLGNLSPRGNFEVGRSFARVGHMDEAAQFMEVAVVREADPSSRQQYYRALLGLLMEAGQLLRAEKISWEVVQLSPLDKGVVLGLARVLIEIENYDEAERQLRRVFDDTDVDFCIDWGILAWRRGDLETAEAWFQQARGLQHSSGVGDYYLAELENSRGHKDSAIKLLELANAKGVNSVPLWLALAHLYHESRNAIATDHAYQQVVRLTENNPSYVWAWVEYAYALEEWGQQENARRIWNQILNMDPENSAASSALGVK